MRNDARNGAGVIRDYGFTRAPAWERSLTRDKEAEMENGFDVVILGAGPGGEVAVNTMLRAGKRVALVESELIGGECTNWGCIPSKTLLRPPDLKGETNRAGGVATAQLHFERLAEYRDYMVSNHDDARRIASYESRGVTVVKAEGTIVGPGRVEAGGRTLQGEAIIVATGAEAVIPPIPGLREAGFWTNREATALSELPRRSEEHTSELQSLRH